MAEYQQWINVDTGDGSRRSRRSDLDQRRVVRQVRADRLARLGRAASGAADGVAYFSPDGQAWHYAGTIDAAGGWSPAVVKGSDYGFVVTGTTAKNQYVAYTSTGTGGTWLPTGPLGDSSTTSKPTAAVGPGEAVVAVWSANATKTGQQALFVKADTVGDVQPVSLAAIRAPSSPREPVKSAAVASDGTIIAVGSADGYPAVWQGASGGGWRLGLLRLPRRPPTRTWPGCPP